MRGNIRVAIVHDYLTQFGGAERVLEALMELFPHAPVFTLLFDKQVLQGIGKYSPLRDTGRLRTSFLQRLPGARRHHRYFPLLMPMAVEQFNLNDFDVVLSASHSFGKGVVTGPKTLHIAYCFTPTRYAWDDSHRYVREFSRSVFFRQLAPAALTYLRVWDYFASQRASVYATLSHYVAKRIHKYYQRTAEVIPPPVDVNRFTVEARDEGYYLVVSRLVPYKRIELAIEACERLGRRLVVAGVGPEIESLRARAGRFTEFTGFVPDTELPRLYAGARALLFPQEEDFGITPLEAAASGKPTIAYAAGGALETILPEKTGVFFHRQTSQAVIAAMLRSEAIDWERADIRQHAETFSRDRFLQRMQALVDNEWLRFSNTLHG